MRSLVESLYCTHKRAAQFMQLVTSSPASFFFAVTRLDLSAWLKRSNASGNTPFSNRRMPSRNFSAIVSFRVLPSRRAFEVGVEGELDHESSRTMSDNLSFRLGRSVITFSLPRSTVGSGRTAFSRENPARERLDCRGSSWTLLRFLGLGFLSVVRPEDCDSVGDAVPRRSFRRGDMIGVLADCAAPVSPLAVGVDTVREKFGTSISRGDRGCRDVLPLLVMIARPFFACVGSGEESRGDRFTTLAKRSPSERLRDICRVRRFCEYCWNCDLAALFSDTGAEDKHSSFNFSSIPVFGSLYDLGSANCPL
mmetsp:Transcript_12341/g.34813  ORF Transcript_12341/g.34813 Transcript_12341/m.34813 type:complete len:309 (-) Transcript_12341:273-1199(-)